MKYSNGVWTRSKEGELEGFRSSVTLVQELKLGVFVAALQSEVDEKVSTVVQECSGIALRTRVVHFTPV
jgi:hypothetical protein